MGEVTDKELVDICNKFMLSAPPGEFMEVVTDIRGLLEKESLLNASAPQTFKKYNEAQMLATKSHGKDHTLLITEYGNAGSADKYYDGRGNQIVTFDHIKQQVTGASPGGPQDAGLEPMRKAFEDAAFDYVDNHHPDGATSVYAVGGKIVVCIQSSKYNPNNYWNGRWRAVYKIDVGGGQAKIAGTIRTQVHYYEDGNVQLNTETATKAAQVPKSDPKATAVAALDKIKELETEFSKALEVSYHTMSDTCFKALRRALPITRTKIDWAKIRNYKVKVGNK